MSEPSLLADKPEIVAQRGRVLWEKRLLLAFGDGVAVTVAFVLAFNLRSAEIRHDFFSIPRVPLLIVLSTWYLCAEISDGYQLISAVNPRAAFATAASALSLSFISLLGVFFVVPYRITRPTILLWVPIAAALILAWRTAYQQIFAQSFFAGNLIVIANQLSFERVWAEAAAGLPELYHVTQIIEPKRSDLTAYLARMAEESVPPDVVIGIREGEGLSPDLLRSLVACCGHSVRVRFLTDLFEEMTGRTLLDQIDYAWITSLPAHSGGLGVYAFLKRALDLLIGGAEAVLLLVLCPFIALAIKVEDGGRVFYRQTRVGRFGHQFEILKIRTMRDGDKTVESQTERRDSRITVVGRVLRPLHLDELPQAINILRGEMSLVGPRPEQPLHAANLDRQLDFYNLRLLVRPGMTGWAQANFGYGAGLEGARKKLSYDLYYVRRQSLGLDLLILARTIRAIVSFRGR